MTAAPPSANLRRLKRRAEFLRAARGNRAGRSAFGMQVIASDAADPGIGFTVTKKIGNAPERSRIKRRLRAAAAACADDFRPGHDYVVLARREALSRPFDKLVGDLSALVARLHDGPSTSTRNPADAGHRNA